MGENYNSGRLTWLAGKSPCSIEDIVQMLHFPLLCSTRVLHERKFGQTKPPTTGETESLFVYRKIPTFFLEIPGKISVQVDGVQLHGVHLSESSDDSALRQHGTGSLRLLLSKLNMTNLLEGNGWKAVGNLGSMAN